MRWLGNLLQQSIKWNAHALAYEFATFLCTIYCVFELECCFGINENGLVTVARCIYESSGIALWIGIGQI